MNKAVELPIVQPLYGTYQNHGAGSAVLKSNPSIRNWYLNQVMILPSVTANLSMDSLLLTLIFSKLGGITSHI